MTSTTIIDLATYALVTQGIPSYRVRFIWTVRDPRDGRAKCLRRSDVRRPTHKPLFINSHMFKETARSSAHRVAKISLDNICETVSMVVVIVAAVLAPFCDDFSDDYWLVLLCQLLRRPHSVNPQLST